MRPSRAENDLPRDADVADQGAHRPQAKQSSAPGRKPRAPAVRLRRPPSLGHHAAVAASPRPHRRHSVGRAAAARAGGGAVARALAARARRGVRPAGAGATCAGARHGGVVPPDEALLARVAGRLETAAAPRLAARGQRHRRRAAHQPRPRAARRGGGRRARRRRARRGRTSSSTSPTGRRGDRDALVADDLCALTGAEAAPVVNNNAAAVLLALNTLAGGPRGDRVARRAGRDRRHLPHARRDGQERRAAARGRHHQPHPRRRLRRAIGAADRAAAEGRTPATIASSASPPRSTSPSWSAIGRARGVPVMEDLGSGALVDLAAVRPAARAGGRASAIAAGADLVTFSGDKLLGGPQAGLIVGRARPDRRACARNPLRRALRSDKLTLAALAATLRLYRKAPDLRRGAADAALAHAPARRDGGASGARGAPRCAARARRRATRSTLVDVARPRSAAARCRPTPLPSRALAVDAPDGRRRRDRRALPRRRARRSSAASTTAASCSTCAASSPPRTLLVDLATPDAMPLIIGTAGHIDHGKTALIRALTGQDTDRLKEEKERGISIDLGFACLDGPDGERAGIVDVPGPRALHPQHARRRARHRPGAASRSPPTTASCRRPRSTSTSCTCSACGAASSSITKVDLVDAARRRGGARGDRDPALDTEPRGRADRAPCRRSTGDGLDALRAAIAAALRGAAAPRRRDGYFRLPVDRAFVMHGHGVVVTGTAIAGDGRATGDTVRVLPGGDDGARAQRRGARRAVAARAGRGQRVALNLGGVEHGDVAARPRRLRPAPRARRPTRFDAWVEVRPGARRALAQPRPCARPPRHRRGARQAGAARRRAPSCAARSAGWAQLVLREPVVALRGDRFILRDETARWTLGGGVVVHPFADRHRRATVAATLERLHTGSDATAAATFLETAPDFAVDAGTVAQALGMRIERAVAALALVDDAIPVPDPRRPGGLLDDASQVGSLRGDRARRGVGAAPGRAAGARSRDGEPAQRGCRGR